MRSVAIAQDKLAWAFLTNIPITPGHTLIAPVRHTASLESLTDAEVASIRALAKTVAHALKETFGAEGFNYAWNEGVAAGQSIPHFHLHVVPRKKGDAGITEYEPRKFLYRPGSREKTPEEELREVADLIKKNLPVV